MWVFFLSMFGTRGFHGGPGMQRGCVPASCVEMGNCWGHVSPGKGQARLVGSAVLPFVCLVPPGKARCFSTLGELPRAGSAGSRSLLSRLAGLASSRGIQASQVGSCRRIRVCGVIKTCKVVPSSPFLREAGGLTGAGITALVEVVLVLVWLSWRQAVAPLASLVGYCRFYPSQICSPGKILNPCAAQMVETPLNEMFGNGRDVTAKESSLTGRCGGTR